MEICEEMLKVRCWLDQRGIEWFDLSDMFMIRTHVDIGKINFSVINGVGSYGGNSKRLKYRTPRGGEVRKAGRR